MQLDLARQHLALRRRHRARVLADAGLPWTPGPLLRLAKDEMIHPTEHVLARCRIAEPPSRRIRQRQRLAQDVLRQARQIRSEPAILSQRRADRIHYQVRHVPADPDEPGRTVEAARIELQRIA